MVKKKLPVKKSNPSIVKSYLIVNNNNKVVCEDINIDQVKDYFNTLVTDEDESGESSNEIDILIQNHKVYAIEIVYFNYSLITTTTISDYNFF